MLQFFINPWALFGLLGVSLAVIAHLISRRRFDVIQWGAMQFLNPARKTRRKLKLEELLLMLLRMALIALVTLAISRPWLPSGLFSGYRSMGSRSVVLILDGSNSMSRGDGLNTLHQNARRRALEFLQTLGPGDAVALIDARDQPRSLVESPLQDRTVLQDAIRLIPDPQGSVNVEAAVELGIAILGKTSSSSREIILLTDRQRAGWQPDQDDSWNRLEDLMTFPSVRPRLWVVDVANRLAPLNANVAVGQLQLTRELTVPDFPVRITASVLNNGRTAIEVPVSLLLDSQPLAGQAQQVQISAGSQTEIQFDVMIKSPGTHILTVEAEVSNDPIEVDNRSHAAIHVSPALPILIVDGSDALIASDRESFFAEVALGSVGTASPWVAATVRNAADVTAVDIQNAAMIVLADVASLPTGIPEQLAHYCSEGGGLLIAVGPQTTTESFDRLFSQTGLLPQVQLNRQREAPQDEARQVTVAQTSLQSGWLDRFRSDTGRSFLKARYQKWWLAIVGATNTTRFFTETDAGIANSGVSDGATDSTQLIDSLLPDKTAGSDADFVIDDVSPDAQPAALSARVLAELSPGDPLLIEASHGRGTILVLTSGLSRRWNNLPTVSDFVPFLHEAIFHVAASRTHRNLNFGTPIIVPFPADIQQPDGSLPAAGFWCPGGRFQIAKQLETSGEGTPKRPKVAEGKPPGPAGLTQLDGEADDNKKNSGNQRSAAYKSGVLTDTTVPGIYDLLAQAPEDDKPPTEQQRLDRFVVNYDHREDEIAELTADDRNRLQMNDRVRFTESLEDLVERMYAEESRTELWNLLILLFPCLLLAELFMTRRLIQKGYSGADGAI